jgi:hypothetical protein
MKKYPARTKIRHEMLKECNQDIKVFKRLLKESKNYRRCLINSIYEKEKLKS